ncbi:hypothetical protein ECE50_004885 [Chitinophaga sp. Mgbs1]|uniref:Uncharacterized protein n=1 Tax=Chitinophaga solisilvae TaxID=1233460 RepID=A0A3S1JI18_9BACT|nr:hypothetical protein [Chitinophaga solisilvae]
MIDSNTNFLLLLHALYAELPIKFRERVCEECGWSLPTFYRNMRAINRVRKDNKVIPAISRAEKDKIREVCGELEECLQRGIKQIFAR